MVAWKIVFDRQHGFMVRPTPTVPRTALPAGTPMWSALLRAKTSKEVRAAVAGAEDALTSSVFDALRWTDPHMGLLPFLARAIGDLRLDNWLGRVTRVEVELWPRWPERVHGGIREPALEDDDADGGPRGSREPDVVVKLEAVDGRRGWLLVEAKHRSGKSKSAPWPGVPGDQLGRQWWHLRVRAPAAGAEPLGIVFLTAGLGPDLLAFDQTRSELDALGLPPPPLSWLSWRAFVETVENLQNPPVLLEDAARLLSEVWGFSPIRFSEWTSPPRMPAVWQLDIAWPRPPRAQAIWSIDIGATE